MIIFDEISSYTRTITNNMMNSYHWMQFSYYSVRTVSEAALTRKCNDKHIHFQNYVKITCKQIKIIYKNEQITNYVSHFADEVSINEWL